MTEDEFRNAMWKVMLVHSIRDVVEKTGANAVTVRRWLTGQGSPAVALREAFVKSFENIS